MKNLKIIYILFIGLTVFSCGDDFVDVDSEDKNSEATLWLSGGIFGSMELIRDHPIEKLKERLIEAGLRTS